jgi:hypothetical protein
MPLTTSPPIIESGSTLSIPRASKTENGYLSKEDFILFSEGSAVAVTSFNTRTGEVLLLDDDVLAALGYAPLNRAGDTMTGPLTLSGPPSSALHAATRGYVDTNAAGAEADIYRVAAYGASGSSNRYSGSISNGQSVLTTTTASDFAIGHGILVKGAGASGADLVTKVAAITGTSVTLQNSASTTISAVANNVQHDDTVAIQTAIDAAFGAGGGTVLFNSGYFRINKGWTDFNSILKVPHQPQSDKPVPISFKSTAAHGHAGGVASTLGSTVIQTDLVGSGSRPSMLSYGPYDNEAADFSTCSQTPITMESLTWRTYDNPQINGLDLIACGGYTILRDVTIDTGMPIFNQTEPTHGTFGLNLPGNNLTSFIDCTNVGINAYAVGCVASEVAQFNNTVIFACGVGLWILSGYHLLSGRLLIWHCPTFIQFSSTAISNVIDFAVAIEYAYGPPGDPAWVVPAANHGFYDPNNHARGKIEYIAIQGTTGTHMVVPYTGMTNVAQINLSVPVFP